MVNHIERRVYSDHQYIDIGALDAWYILLDIHNAIVYNFVQNRLPEPGRPIDVTEAEQHVANVEKEWQSEKMRRDFSNDWAGAPPFSAMPLNAKLYLHSTLRDAWQCVRAKEPDDPFAP